MVLKTEYKGVLLFVPYAHKETKFKDLNVVCPFTARENNLLSYEKYSKKLRSIQEIF